MIVVLQIPADLRFFSHSSILPLFQPFQPSIPVIVKTITSLQKNIFFNCSGKYFQYCKAPAKLIYLSEV